MRFQGISKKHKNLENIDLQLSSIEKNLTDEEFLEILNKDKYEIDFNYSEKIGNAEVDFKMPQCNEAPYIIEAKIYKGEKDLDRIKDGTKQLKDYMDRMDTRYGCIFIYSQTDDYFIADESLEKAGIQLVTAYIGDKSPSKRSKTGKTIKVELGQ